MTTARELFNEISKDFKPNKRQPDLGEFTELQLFSKENKIEFSINWFSQFVITFRPQTIGVRIQHHNKKTGESKSISKSYPLTQENLLDTVLKIFRENCLQN